MIILVILWKLLGVDIKSVYHTPTLYKPKLCSPYKKVIMWARKGMRKAACIITGRGFMPPGCAGL
jgi:hypothetical protein